MENNLNYSDYTLDQLYDIHQHIDRKKYPDRYNHVLSEIQKRTSLVNAPDILIEKTLSDLKEIVNIDLWFKILTEKGITIHDELKLLISQIFPFLKFESIATFSVSESKLSITFPSIRKHQLYFASTYLFLSYAVLLYLLLQTELRYIFLIILVIIIIFSIVRISKEIKNHVKKIEIIFFENSNKRDILIQFSTFSTNNRKLKLDLFEIRKIKVVGIPFIFYLNYLSQFKAKLKSGREIYFGYFKNKELLKTICNYFNDKI